LYLRYYRILREEYKDATTPGEGHRNDEKPKQEHLGHKEGKDLRKVELAGSDNRPRYKLTRE
jgi:hypothetical protein